jgi:hypothetical protein
MNETTNSVGVAGRLKGLELSHRIYGEAFYTFFWSAAGSAIIRTYCP